MNRGCGPLYPAATAAARKKSRNYAVPGRTFTHKKQRGLYQNTIEKINRQEYITRTGTVS
jgi:hypothetical protein